MSRREQATAAKPTRPKSPVATAEAFIRAWQTSETSAEAAGKIGVTDVTARARAIKFRSRGIPLKRFPSSRYSPSFVAELATLARSLTPDAEDDEDDDDRKPVSAPAPIIKPVLAGGRREAIKARAASAHGDFQRPLVVREEDDE